MKIVLFVLFVSIAGSFSKTPEFEALLDLQLGKIDASPRILGKLDEIQTGVVFRRLPHTAMCPTTRGGNFDLKMVNPTGMAAVSEHISMICPIIDTVTIDTTAVWEVSTAQGETYFMRLLERLGEKVKVRVTPDLPKGVVPSTLAPGSEPYDQNEFLSLDLALMDTVNLLLADGDNSSVVLTRLKGPTVCPSTESWEFALKKADHVPRPNPFPAPITRKIGADCRAGSVISIDTNQVYELHTANREFYYLRLTKVDANRIRARLTVEKPPVSLARRLHAQREKGVSNQLGFPIRYRPDGRWFPRAVPFSILER
jgi:hypothetical protein